MADKIEIFISYANEDEEYLEELEKQLTSLGRSKPIEIWHKGKIIPGRDRANEVNTHLKSARVILLLISSAYIALDELYNEAIQAMQRLETGAADVIPVLLRPVPWQDTPFGRLSPLPDNGLPLTSWRNSKRNDAYFNIVQGVRKAIEKVTTPQQVKQEADATAGKVAGIPAKEETMTPQTFSHGYALLVGVGHDLPITVKDATAVRDVLINPARAAYPPNHVQLLTGAQATRQNILAAFEQLAQRVQSDSEATVIVYFSGHGGRFKQLDKPTEYFLVPYGYDPAHRADTAISGSEFTSKVEAINARKLVVLLDCCHAGGVPATKEVGEAFEKAPLPPDLLHILETGSGRVVVASSLENEVSWTGTPYSVFTACLMEALAGKGVGNKDGFARILGVLSYLFDTVPQRTSNKQHPFVNKIQNLSDNFPLCYYAGGSKEVPGEIPAPESPPVPAGLTPGQRRRLETRLKELQGSWDLRNQRVQRLQEALDREIDPLTTFKYERQLLQEKAALEQVENELDEIERALQ
ncbi:MAG TPA: caspase family protein [Ktedonobacteraceae bacterium]|nr:caspase family protein [Ktedonobacteraceae bacterium]